jgi:hypothetical protein
VTSRALSDMAFVTTIDRVDQTMGPPCLAPFLPCWARHGLMITVAHYEEVGMGADDNAGAPYCSRAVGYYTVYGPLLCQFEQPSDEKSAHYHSLPHRQW